MQTPDEKAPLECKSGATDREIERLAYELYGLTEEEIEMVKGGKK